jgi:hypothetical protein
MFEWMDTLALVVASTVVLSIVVVVAGVTVKVYRRINGVD